MGRLLAGSVFVGPAPPGRVLAGAAAGEPEGHALAERAESAGGLPADRAGQRVSVSPGVVSADGVGRSAGRGFRAGAEGQAVPLSGSGGRASGGVVRRAVRRAALRSDKYLFRKRPGRAGSGKQAATSPSAPFITKSTPGSKRTSSSASWPTACTLRCATSPATTPADSARAPFSRNWPRCR